MTYIPLSPSFSLFLSLFFLALHQFQRLSQLQQCLVCLQFPLPWCGYCYGCYTKSLGLLFWGFWVTLIIQWNLIRFCVWYIALQKLQAITLMLCRMAFSLCGKVDTLHLGNNSAITYLYNLGDMLHLFLFKLACYISYVANMHGITLIPVYMHIHLIVEDSYLSWEG